MIFKKRSPVESQPISHPVDSNDNLILLYGKYTMNDKFILNFTPTGLIPTKEMTPNVPLSPEEIVEQVLEAAEMGINMVHLHAREVETGLPTYKKEIYGEIIGGIRKKNKDLSS